MMTLKQPLDTLDLDQKEKALHILMGVRGLPTIRVILQKKVGAARDEVRMAKKAMEQAIVRSATAKATLRTNEDFLTTIDVLLEESGLTDALLTVHGESDSAQGQPRKEETALERLDAVGRDRVKRGLCLYRDLRDNWCCSRLDTEEEKRTFHCQKHYDQLSAGIDPGLVTPPRKKRGRRKKA